jgi:hypothetical protein
MKHTRFCTDCSDPLVEGANWLVSCVRNHKYRCVVCKRIDGQKWNAVREARVYSSEETRLKEHHRKLQWKKDNKGYVNQYNKLRYERKRQRTPKWADLSKIKEVYEECKRLIKEYGPRSYHVDHIIPLKGKNVSGLHVENNLQIIKASENLTKGNKYETH